MGGVASPPPAASLQVGADDELSSKPAATDPASTDDNAQENGRRGAFVIAPVPMSSPAIGTGLVPVVGYIFNLNKADKISPASVIGVAGLFTDNGTRAFALGTQLYLAQDTYRLRAAFLHGNINYDLYGSGVFTGLKLPLKQTGQIFLGEFQRRIAWKFYLGPRLFTGNSVLTLRPAAVNIPAPPDLGLHTTLTALGLRLSRDTSANRFYPTDGSFLTFTADFFSKGLGSKYSFQTYRTAFSKYWSLTEKQVLAYNAYLCVTGGEPPFYGNCIYGTNNELRGYIGGKYFDRYMAATQLEYRLMLPKRFGVVAFGGLGGVVPGGDQLLFKHGSFLPAGGGGLRFELSKKHHVNLRADIGRGTDGHTFALGVGEAF